LAVMMKRRHVHWLFATAVLASGAMVAVTAWQWRQLLRINQAVAAAAVTPLAPDAPDEAMLARAIALAGQSQYQSALAAYQAVVNGPRADLAHDARYNLGNLYLREALKDGASQAFKSVPLIEMAKQSYRAALRADPDDWDSRFNLQRALALAPEFEQAPVVDNEPPTPRERTTSTLPGSQSDLP
jgi:mxaK protein